MGMVISTLLVTLLPLVDTTPMRVPTALQAQTMLADAIGTADSVDYVRVHADTIVFGIERAGEAFDVVATITPAGRVTALEIDDRGSTTRKPGPFSWLTDVMKETGSVVRLVVGETGEVTVITGAGDQYHMIEGRGRNTAVEARWAAAWNV